MKQFLFILSCIYCFTSFAQSPQAFNYQAVVRNSNGQIIANQQVSLRLSVTDAANGGNILYRESHTATTNQFGLVNVAVGNGNQLNGTFASISWGSGSRYLQVEVDPAGGSTYTNLGTAQLLSVPYALYAETSGNGGGTQGATGATGATGAKGDTGAKGATGAQGNTGAAGQNGTTGITGATGTNGLNGLTGATGAQGVTGATGTTGTAGAAGDRYSTTSTTSLTISAGAKTLTVGTGLSYAVGQTVIVANSATNIMTGTVTAYNGATGVMSVNVTSINGSGTFAVWTVALNGAPGPAGATGAQGQAGTTGATGATGTQGIKGATGATGANGTNGLNGATGATGATGAQGTFSPTASINGVTLRNNGTNWEPSLLLFNTGSRIGINTTAPEAKLYVADSSVVFGNINILPPDGVAGTVSPSYSPTQGSPLASGMGLMWYANKAAFRTGAAVGTNSSWQAANMGYYSAAFGFNARAGGIWSMASGFGVAATGDASVSFGYTLTAPSFAEMAVGMFNTNYTPNSTTSYNASDRLFVVGNGVNNASRSNALTVFKNGRTQIGNNGTAITNVQEGIVSGGTQNLDNRKFIPLTFPKAFTTANVRVLLTPKLANGVRDAFILSVRNITTTQCIIEIFRADAPAGTGWGTAFDISWMAWE